MDEFKEVELTKIVSWFGEVRPVYPRHVRNLSKSLRLHGQIIPVVVEPLDGRGKYRGIVYRHVFWRLLCGLSFSSSLPSIEKCQRDVINASSGFSPGFIKPPEGKRPSKQSLACINSW